MRATSIPVILLAASAMIPLTVALAEPVAVSPGAPQPLVNITPHATIEINRPPAAIWPHILHSNAWTVHKLRHLDGPAGEVGETFAVVPPARPETLRTWAENVEVTSDRRRAFKLYEKDDRLRGYVIWTLNEVNGRTVVSYDLYYELVLSPEESQRMSAPSALAQHQRESEEKSKKQMEGELAALKRLVEST